MLGSRTSDGRARIGGVRWIAAACGAALALGAYGVGTTAAFAKTAKPTVAFATVGGVGKVLVDAQGRTLYLFEADKGTMSACAGGCTSVWPPLTTTGKVTAGTGLAAAKLGTAKRSDGSTEVTYNGHPLYTYAGDSGPGQTAGQGIDEFGAEWYALSPSGNKIDNG